MTSGVVCVLRDSRVCDHPAIIYIATENYVSIQSIHNRLAFVKHKFHEREILPPC